MKRERRSNFSIWLIIAIVIALLILVVVSLQKKSAGFGPNALASCMCNQNVNDIVNAIETCTLNGGLADFETYDYCTPSYNSCSGNCGAVATCANGLLMIVQGTCKLGIANSAAI